MVLRHHTVLGGGGLGNWFGDGADGDIRITSTGAEQSLNGGVAWQAVPGWTKVGGVVMVPSVQDGDMVVVNAISLTINASMSFTTTNRCRGLMILIQKDLTVNGTVTVTARGAHANPADTSVTSNTPVPPSDGAPVPSTGLELGWFAKGHNTPFAPNLSGCGTAAVEAMANQLAGDGLKLNIPRAGGPGGAAVSNSNGKPGGESDGGTGGGGSGAAGRTPSSSKGGDGTCFSGGTGGGGNADGAYTGLGPIAGENFGGRGGRSDDYVEPSHGGGGPGNPGGEGMNNGQNGTAGLLILVVGGNILGTGTISSNGSLAGNGSPAYQPCGGGSGGGGILVIACAGIVSPDIDFQANGGASVGGGGIGGPGSIHGPHKIDRAA